MRTLPGKAIDLEVGYLTTVEDIKHQIEDKEETPPDLQRLIFAGEALQDPRMVREYNIPNKASIHLVLRLRGGMFYFTSGRQDFQNLPFYLQTTIQSISGFQFEGIKESYYSRTTEIEDSILEAQKLFSISTTRKELDYVRFHVPHFADSLSLMVGEDDGDNSNNP